MRLENGLATGRAASAAEVRMRASAKELRDVHRRGGISAHHTLGANGQMMTR